MKIYELTPGMYDHVKSFYGKAQVIEEDNGTKSLKSYNTIVCRLTPKGEIVRTWGGYSVTSMRHINTFLSLFNIPGGGKAWWDKLEVKEG